MSSVSEWFLRVTLELGLSSPPALLRVQLAACRATKLFLPHFYLGCGGGWGYRLGFRVYERGLYSNNFMGNAMVDLG